MGKIFDLLSDKEKRRKQVVHLYVTKFGPLITKGTISATSAMASIAESDGTTRANIYSMLFRAGAYVNKHKPVVPEVDDYDELSKELDCNIN